MGFLTDTVDEVRRRLARDPLDESRLMALALKLPPARAFAACVRKSRAASLSRAGMDWLRSITAITVAVRLFRTSIGRASRRTSNRITTVRNTMAAARRPVPSAARLRPGFVSAGLNNSAMMKQTKSASA